MKQPPCTLTRFGGGQAGFWQHKSILGLGNNMKRGLSCLQESVFSNVPPFPSPCTGLTCPAPFEKSTWPGNDPASLSRRAMPMLPSLECAIHLETIEYVCRTQVLMACGSGTVHMCRSRGRGAVAEGRNPGLHSQCKNPRRLGCESSIKKIKNPWRTDRRWRRMSSPFDCKIVRSTRAVTNSRAQRTGSSCQRHGGRRYFQLFSTIACTF